MKIVCDTNVLVSGILFYGNPQKVLNLVSKGDIRNFISPVLLREVEEVLLRPKFNLQTNQVTHIIALFRETFELVHPIRRVHAVKEDPDDNRVLETASIASVDFIVSGDKHLLTLKKWNNIWIIPPAQLIKEFNEIQNKQDIP